MPPLAAFQQFLYFEMTKKDILKQENEHSETIHLHKEGAFWKAYEYSAYILVFAVMNCKPKKQVFREIDSESLKEMRDSVCIGSIYTSDFNNEFFVDRNVVMAMTEDFYEKQKQKYGDKVDEHLSGEEFADFVLNI